MILSGRFPFLHTRNVAWLIKALQFTTQSGDDLYLKLLIEPVLTTHDEPDYRPAFLSAFGFVHQIANWQSGDPDPGPVPPPSDSDEVNVILNPWINSLRNTRVFASMDSFSTVLPSLAKSAVITTNGCFDILHPGHVATLNFAAKQGNCLIVLINSDASVKRFKGNDRPIHSEWFRGALLSRLDAVDYVVIFDEDNPLKALRQLKPAGHVKGGSFLPERIKSEQALLSTWGGCFHPFPMQENFSTTRILQHYSEPPFPI